MKINILNWITLHPKVLLGFIVGIVSIWKCIFVDIRLLCKTKKDWKSQRDEMKKCNDSSLDHSSPEAEGTVAEEKMGEKADNMVIFMRDLRNDLFEDFIKFAAIEAFLLFDINILN